MTVPPPHCLQCKHYQEGSAPPTCKAYQLEIIAEIWIGGDPHTKPMPGDNGIQFEPKTKK